jgi:general secretion pathway protein M
MTDPTVQQLKDLWAGLGAGERSLVVSALAVVAMLVLYFALLQPVQNQLVHLRQNVPREFQQLQWMRAQAPVAQQLRGHARPTAPANLPSAIEQSAQSVGFKPQIAPNTADGGRSLQVTLDAVAFNSLASWLTDLQQSYGVVVEEAAIDAQTTPGIVNARLRLRAAGA